MAGDKEFVNLGSAVTTKTDVNLEIKHRITFINWYSVLRFSGYAGSAMSFVRRRMLLRGVFGYLIWGSAKVGEEDDLVPI